jgi:adenylate cyclase
LLQLPPINRREEAELCFGTAISIARRQRAKSLELRAAVSLAMLWCDEGKRNQAREMLLEVYDWFSEGFETADLKVAKLLLTKLAS